MPSRKHRKKKRIDFKYHTVDDVFLKIKSFGPFQWFLCLLYGYHFTVVIVNDGFMSFGGIKPHFQCMDDAPYAENNAIVDSLHCDLYNKCSKENFTFHSPFYTIVEQYRLVCQKSYYAELITSLQFFGIMIGAIVSGPVSDYFGRKWPFLFMLFCEMSMGALISLAPTWQIHAGLRFVLGICAGADMNIGWVFMSEFTTNNWRFLFRALSIVIPNLAFPTIGIITKNWRTFELVGNLICTPLLVIIALWTFESPRWLIQQGRGHEAAEVFRRVARFNGIKRFQINPQELPSVDKVKRIHFWKLFGTAQIAKYSFASIATWFVTAMVNFGMFFDLGNLPYNIYISQFLAAGFTLGMQMPLAFLDTFKSLNFNRRNMLLVFLVVISAINALIGGLILTSVRHTPGLYWIFSVLSVLGQASTTVMFNMAYVYQTELFPTLLRTTAGAMCSASARLGAIVAPQLLYLKDSCSNCAVIPYFAFAGVGLLGFFIDFLILPNTKDKALMEKFGEELKPLEEEEKMGVENGYHKSKF